MKSIDYLNQYRRFKMIIEDITDKIEMLEAEVDAIRSTSASDGLPHGTQIGRPTESLAIQLADSKSDLEKVRLEASVKLAEIYRTILLVTDIDQMKILIYRYVDLMTIPQIAERTYFSERNCYYILSRGLKEVQEIIDEKELKL